MASSFFLFFSSLVIFLLFSPNAALVTLPVKKNLTTLQYYTSLQIGSTLKYHDLVIDLGGQNVWINCEDYISSSYKPVPCGSRRCDNSGGLGCVGCYGYPKPGCTNDTCGSNGYNPYSNLLYAAGLGEDDILVKSNGGIRKLPNFALACSYYDNLQGLASGISGMVGLAVTNISLHEQITSKTKMLRMFSLCIPSSNAKRSGSMFIGGRPTPSKSLITTPFVINPVSTAPMYSEGEASNEYFINVKSIKIDGKVLAIKTPLLAIDKNGVGGTKISTIANYTVLHSSIYKTVTKQFSKKASAMKIRRVSSVKPFTMCFNSKTIGSTTTGPNVPIIDLVLQREEVYWRIYGHNSMVKVSKDVMCLGFIDGGKKPRTSIVLGGHQLEDNLIEFDLVLSKFGFSNSLLLQNTSCSP